MFELNPILAALGISGVPLLPALLIWVVVFICVVWAVGYLLGRLPK